MVYILIVLCAAFILLFAVWMVTYYALCGYNILLFMWTKWIKRECPHVCIWCKYKNICEKRNPP